jgi:hypothetical protein
MLYPLSYGTNIGLGKRMISVFGHSDRVRRRKDKTFFKKNLEKVPNYTNNHDFLIGLSGYFSNQVEVPNARTTTSNGVWWCAACY